MDIAANKAIARRYFSEMVGKRSDKLIEELWTEDCVVHRPEVSATIRGARHLGRPSIGSLDRTARSRQQFMTSLPRTILSCVTYRIG
jgi:hypothetical protein